MLRRWMASLVKLLNRPLFGTQVIPRGAVVDASLFSEDEFPVHCTKCRYLLRGLPDGRCPECGTTFQRGRLLVWQYVLKHDEPSFRSTQAGKWASRLWIAAIVLQLAVVGGASFGLPQFVLWPTMLANGQQTSGWFWRLFYVMVVVAGIAWLMFIGAAILHTRHFYRTRAKRRRVFEALSLPET